MISPRVNCTSTLPTAHEGKPGPLAAAPEHIAPAKTAPARQGAADHP